MVLDYAFPGDSRPGLPRPRALHPNERDAVVRRGRRLLGIGRLDDGRPSSRRSSDVAAVRISGPALIPRLALSRPGTRLDAPRPRLERPYDGLQSTAKGRPGWDGRQPDRVRRDQLGRMLLCRISGSGAERSGFRLQGRRIGRRPDEPGAPGLHPDLPGRGKQPRHRLHPIQQHRGRGASHDGGKRATAARKPDLRPAPRTDRIRNPLARDGHSWRRRLRGFALPGRRSGRESHVWGFRGGRRDGSQR